jgi:hypothetical protein
MRSTFSSASLFLLFGFYPQADGSAWNLVPTLPETPLKLLTFKGLSTALPD